ncbi:PREDICTED: auxin-responsive protein IAA33 [Populus euphratica]|uniref:Auxin-responsive protein n=1 Tax=Populus euphratica TaxID=75702 RepID=A0AAJ6Y6C9_POPEU|nr:PREDICTED: auxin-responsive protein IAA33 [Populus euphratica]
MNSSFGSKKREDSLKGRWQEIRRSFPNMSQYTRPTSSVPNFMAKPITFPGFEDDDVVSTIIPPVTVALEGRSICQRISLHKHESYHSLAKALRQMFVDIGAGSDSGLNTSSASDSVSDHDLDLSNAIPGHLIAYEDIENDLLLAGDLNWKDFVRVAKRIRILPAKGNSRKATGGTAVR